MIPPPAMAHYFISDIHLGLGSRTEERAKEDRLLAFLRSILPSTDQLFIVGDLFDFWFEYKTVVPKGFHRTLTALQEFSERGIPVHYLAGNHDYWMGDHFRTDLGLTLHLEPFDVVVGGKRIHVHHGDGLAGNDLGYRLIKPILRNKINIMLYRWLHPDIGVRLAKGSSKTSREYTSGKKFGEDKGMVEYAEKCIAGGTDIVVMGHRHRPYTKPLGKGVYVNLGDWISYNSYGVLKDGIMNLYTWNGQQESLHGTAAAR
jgi:UDP-2,3-diacylglucosamine hydrolase